MKIWSLEIKRTGKPWKMIGTMEKMNGILDCTDQKSLKTWISAVKSKRFEPRRK
jgi:hypothetical protein